MRSPTTSLISGYAVLLSIAMIALAVLTAIGWIQLSDNTGRASYLAGQAKEQSQRLEMVAKQANDAANQAAGLAVAVQAQRLDNIRGTCERDNQRHDRTIKALDKILLRAEGARGLTRGHRIEIRASRVSTILLINALAPHQNCALVTARAQGAK